MNKNGWSGGRQGYICVIRRAKYNAEWNASEKGKAARAKYNASEKGRTRKAEYNARYHASEKFRTSRAKYDASERGRATRAERNSRRVFAGRIYLGTCGFTQTEREAMLSGASV